MNTLEVNGSVMAYRFNHLVSSTSYSFVVTARNGAGLAVKKIDPVSEMTYPGTSQLL